jgi:hypothetical protein
MRGLKYKFGLDVGSTTVKLVVLNDANEMVHSVYRRHFSDVKDTVTKVMQEAYKSFKHDHVTIMVTGSGGMFVERYLGIKHIQEVVAGTTAIHSIIPETDVAIELGGEDSKITYLSGNLEQRMNSICAGGTGAFIDQMASLLETVVPGQPSKVVETVFENRFMHAEELIRMGADIRTEGKEATIHGVKQLHGAEVRATDLRAGAALILAGLVAEGKTLLSDLYHIDRGYVELEERMKSIGANITRVDM